MGLRCKTLVGLKYQSFRSGSPRRRPVVLLLDRGRQAGISRSSPVSVGRPVSGNTWTGPLRPSHACAGPRKFRGRRAEKGIDVPSHEPERALWEDLLRPLSVPGPQAEGRARIAIRDPGVRERKRLRATEGAASRKFAASGAAEGAPGVTEGFCGPLRRPRPPPRLARPRRPSCAHAAPVEAASVPLGWAADGTTPAAAGWRAVGELW